MLKKPKDKILVKEKNKFPGYPIYPSSEDIYNQEKEEKDLDPENPDKIKTTSDDLADNLDITINEPEIIGSEDEENIYYSLGGDNYTGLEED